MPTPAPEPAQIERTREIMGENSYSYVADLISAGTEEESTAKWTETLLDIAEWQSVRDDYVKIHGGREGLDLDSQRQREAISRRVRLRYGLTAVVDSSIEGGFSGSCAVATEVRW